MPPELSPAMDNGRSARRPMFGYALVAVAPSARRLGEGRWHRTVRLESGTDVRLVTSGCKARVGPDPLTGGGMPGSLGRGPAPRPLLRRATGRPHRTPGDNSGKRLRQRRPTLHQARETSRRGIRTRSASEVHSTHSRELRERIHRVVKAPYGIAGRRKTRNLPS